ncbi:MAG: tryptophan synthase subunit alpha [Bacteroidia bacterium]
MNQLDNLFQEKNGNIFSVYFTAGFPRLNDTGIILEELIKNKVDLIEIGIPFSDPLADGPTIQHSDEMALKNGMTLQILFQQLRNFKKKTSSFKTPFILMGYLNPVLQYGVEKFCKEACSFGISGIILPDLPLKEYLNEYKTIFEKYDLKNIFLITPQTSEERVREIDKHSDSFIYMVSSASVTGAKNKISEAQKKYFERIKKMKLKSKTLIGFGISDKKSFETACQYAQGAIIGSAFIKSIEESKNLKKDIQIFVESIKPKS